MNLNSLRTEVTKIKKNLALLKILTKSKYECW